MARNWNHDIVKIELIKFLLRANKNMMHFYFQISWKFNDSILHLWPQKISHMKCRYLSIFINIRDEK